MQSKPQISLKSFSILEDVYIEDNISINVYPGYNLMDLNFEIEKHIRNMWGLDSILVLNVIYFIYCFQNTHFTPFLGGTASIWQYNQKKLKFWLIKIAPIANAGKDIKALICHNMNICRGKVLKYT